MPIVPRPYEAFSSGNHYVHTTLIQCRIGTKVRRPIAALQTGTQTRRGNNGVSGPIYPVNTPPGPSRRHFARYPGVTPKSGRIGICGDIFLSTDAWARVPRRCNNTTRKDHTSVEQKSVAQLNYTGRVFRIQCARKRRDIFLSKDARARVPRRCDSTARKDHTSVEQNSVAQLNSTGTLTGTIPDLYRNYTGTHHSLGSVKVNISETI
jgi:hypothetical protein